MVNASKLWITVSEAAILMGVGKRQALRLLARRDAQMGGMLLRRIGLKRMPSGVQASKYLVCLPAFRESMRPTLHDAERDIEELKIALELTNQKVNALRLTVRPMVQLSLVQNAS